jgi:hypothetical protein
VHKDWRNAACTRYRPFFTVCLCIFLILITWAVLAFIGHVTIKQKTREYDQKIEKLTVGMEEKDLIRIMGNPVSRETIKSADWQSIPAEIKRQHEYLVSYGYWLLSFYSTSELRSHTVFLDESDKRIVYVMPTFALSVLMGFRADDLFKLILVIEAVLIWLGVKWWCRRKRKLST